MLLSLAKKRRRVYNMWMSEIKIKNFRPFYGDQILNFREDSQEKFTIIEAKSDTGKTTLLSALCWCLYGKDLGDYGKDLKDTNEKSIHPFNLERKDELKDGQNDTLEVEITLNNDRDKNPKYVISRTATCVKNRDKMEYAGNPSLRVEEWQGHKANPIKDPVFSQKVINSILPEDIHMFFLFEGEKLEKIFSFNRKENIQAAIEKISQIQQVKLALDHLQIARDKIYDDKTKGKGDTDIERAQKEIETFQTKIEGLENQKEIFTRGLEQADNTIKEIDTKLSSVNIPLIIEWTKERTNLEKKNKELEGNLKTIQYDVTESLLQNVPIAICSKALNNLLERIEMTSQRNELPPKIKNVYIRELLEKKMCICGRSLNEDENEEAKKATEILNKILCQNDLSELAEKLIEGRYAIKDMFKVFPDKLIKWRGSKLKEITAIQNEINSNLANIEDINKKLSENKQEDIIAKNNERILLVESKEKQLRSITKLENDIIYCKDEIVKRRRIIDDLAKKLKDYNTTKQIADFMDKAYIHLEKINNEILKEVRGKVETRTFDSFMKLHWDKENYKDFSINETYTMSLKDPNGNERIYNIASGTKQVFLLSFIAALAEVSGFKFPILIDTPLANTDNEQRENIATNLPNYLKGNQVVLLVKDQEYTPKFRSLIKDRISQEFRLIKTGGRTEVKPWA